MQFVLTPTFRWRSCVISADLVLPPTTLAWPPYPLQVAKTVLFLASDDALATTGSIYNVDGGWSVKA